MVSNEAQGAYQENVTVLGNFPYMGGGGVSLLIFVMPNSFRGAKTCFPYRGR